MTTAQKVIKYLALAFAIFLIVTIISAILQGLYALAVVIGIADKKEVNFSDTVSTVFESNEDATLKIEVAYTKLEIKTGTVLKAETNNKNIKCIQNNERLEIKEENNNWFSKDNDEQLIVYIPENLEFEKVQISTGAGEVDIEKLNAQEIKFEIGAGKTTIHELNVTDRANIEGGAGEISILSGEIHNLKLDMGIGKTTISSKLMEDSDINSGVGNLSFVINGDSSDYKVKVGKGLGNIKVNGQNMQDDEIYGNGENYIKVDGGIGNINIDFKS